MSREKIIYIMGADFSGTTMLDLMLGSSTNSASIGELAAYLSPTSLEHLEPVCTCHKKCGIWERSNFNDDPYAYLFDRHGVSVLIDSSKQISWVVEQVKNARSPVSELAG